MKAGRLAMVLALGVLDAAACTRAQAPQDTAVVIGAQRVLHSQVLNEDRTVYVGLPDGYEDGGSYPVLYQLDGVESTFHMVTAIARKLAAQERMPPVIIVAVPNPNRVRDLTPAVEHPSANVPAGAGGADDFLGFLSQELIPHIDAEYRTTFHRTIVGISFGGLFAVHALTTTPAVFRTYLAISPSLWWDNQALVRRMEQFLKQVPEGTRHLSLTIASEGPMMRRPLDAMVELLRREAPAGLQWDFQEFREETHDTVALQAIYAGLIAAFADWRLSADTLAEGIAGLERHVQHRAATYGFPPEVPAGAFVSFGMSLLEQGSVALALESFERAATLNPRSPVAFLGLSQAYERLDRLPDAITSAQKALEIASATNDPLREHAQQELDRLRARQKQPRR